MWIISACSLIFVSSACFVAIFANSIKDNLLERVGMVFLCIGCISRINNVILLHDVTAIGLLIHFGMALYAAGIVKRFIFRKLRHSDHPVIVKYDRWRVSRLINSHRSKPRR